MLRNGWLAAITEGPFSFLGGFAPEWVALLRNNGAFWPQKTAVLPILGGYAPERMGAFFSLRLGGNAPVHPLHNPR